MAAGSSSIKLPGPLPMKESLIPRLNPAPQAQTNIPAARRSTSRGRSLLRKSHSVDRPVKGGLDHSRPSMAKGKGKQTMVSSPHASPAAWRPQPNNARKVFEEMPSSSRGQPQGKSWAAVAKSASKGYSLSYIPPVSHGGKLQVSISEDMLHASDPKWTECLVGYLIGKRLPFKLVEAALKHVWGNKLVDVMANDEGFFFLQIPDNEYRKEILDGGPLTIAKVPLVLQQWHPLINLEKKKHETVPIWIRLRNIPFSLWSAVGISAIASAVGKPLYVDSQTEKMRMLSYARVCVEIRAGAGLPDVVELDLMSEVRNVRVEYEWRPPCCSSCLAFGHKCPPPKDNLNQPAIPLVVNAPPPASASPQDATAPADLEGWQQVSRRKGSPTLPATTTTLIPQCPIVVHDPAHSHALPAIPACTSSVSEEDTDPGDTLVCGLGMVEESVPSSLPLEEPPPSQRAKRRAAARAARAAEAATTPIPTPSEAPKQSKGRKTHR